MKAGSDAAMSTVKNQTAPCLKSRLATKSIPLQKKIPLPRRTLSRMLESKLNPLGVRFLAAASPHSVGLGVYSGNPGNRKT
jgi:hypothetical protein